MTEIQNFHFLVLQAMIPVKDTRELLYKLLKAEYVQIQEVARTSDHAPSRTFYLWRVDLLRVVEQVGRTELLITTQVYWC